MGVTIIAALATITGILLVVSGIVITLVTPVTVTTTPLTSTDNLEQETLTPPIAVLAMAAIPIAIGVAYLATASGLLNGRRWSWSSAQILSIITIAVSAMLVLLSGNILMLGNIIIGAAILYYLHTAKVKAYFGIPH